MGCARSLASAKARALHVPRARFISHASLSMLFLASDEIERLYIQKYDESLIINGLVVKIIRNQVTSLCNECPLSLNSIFFS